MKRRYISPAFIESQLDYEGCIATSGAGRNEASTNSWQYDGEDETELDFTVSYFD